MDIFHHIGGGAFEQGTGNGSTFVAKARVTAIFGWEGFADPIGLISITTATGIGDVYTTIRGQICRATINRRPARTAATSAEE
tara:strand:+ start:401 stop:649 length:249 start_codon:yes stop_codon:yes gene_type:complete